MARFDSYNLYVHLRVLCKIPFGNIDSRYKVNMKCYENNISACHINASLFFLHLPLLEKPYPSMRAAVVTWSQEITRNESAVTKYSVMELYARINVNTINLLF